MAYLLTYTHVETGIVGTFHVSDKRLETLAAELRSHGFIVDVQPLPTTQRQHV
jgi:hypothetical protein